MSIEANDANRSLALDRARDARRTGDTEATAQLDGARCPRSTIDLATRSASA